MNARKSKKPKPATDPTRGRLLQALTRAFDLEPIAHIEIRHVVGRQEAKVYVLAHDQFSVKGGSIEKLADQILEIIVDDARNFSSGARYAVHFHVFVGFERQTAFKCRVILDLPR